MLGSSHGARARWGAGVLLVALVLVSAPAIVAADATEAVKELQKAVKAKNADQARSILEKIASAGIDEKALGRLIGLAPKCAGLDIYDDLAKALGSPADDAAFAALTKAFSREKKQPIRFLLADAIGQTRREEAVDALAEALTDKDDIVASAAARAMARIPSPLAIDELINALGDLEKAKGRRRQMLEVLAAIRNLTGEDMQDAVDWRNWWDGNRDSWKAPGEASEGGDAPKKGGTVVDRLKRERPSEFHTISGLTKDDIVVVSGASDKVQDVLKAIDIPYTYVRRDAFDGLELDPKQVLILNCAGNEKLSEEGIAKIRKFVHEGGYVFSSDWELRNTLVKAFPEMLEFSKESPREDFKVEIGPGVKQSGHPLLRDVFTNNPWETMTGSGTLTWEIAGRSHIIRIKKGVTVLIRSPQLHEKTGNGDVAITFQVTGGRIATGIAPARQIGAVLHVLSHFEKQKNPEGDGFALQQLLLNYILEKQEGRRREMRK